jgi:hypothetical protein
MAGHDELHHKAPFHWLLLSSDPETLQQPSCIEKIGQIDAVGEFAIDRRQQFPRFGIAAASAPQAGQAMRGAQLPKLCVLALRGFQR